MLYFSIQNRVRGRTGKVSEAAQWRLVDSDCGCHLLRHALVGMTAYHLLVVIGLFAGGDGLSALGPFHLHVSPRCLAAPATKSQTPTSPNTAPATQNASHD